MDVHAARDDERMLRRVIALLVAFAALAERVAARSWLVRWFVLAILRRAETVAQDFVLEAAGMSPSDLEGIAAVGNGPDDALRLAARFRALAALLALFLPVDCLSDGPRGPHGTASCQVTSVSVRRLSGWAWKPNDTS